jgi:hypothetical protein
MRRSQKNLIIYIKFELCKILKFSVASTPPDTETPLALTPSFSPGPKSTSTPSQSEPTSPPPSDDNSADQGFNQGAKPLIFPSSAVRNRNSQIYLIPAYVLVLFSSLFAS